MRLVFGFGVRERDLDAFLPVARRVLSSVRAPE
jgi:hypothetical protein